ncbi:MAG: alcohol dehydrogenase catalytic domain-containing protein [Janthinobacterium lividum]
MTSRDNDPSGRALAARHEDPSLLGRDASYRPAPLPRRVAAVLSGTRPVLAVAMERNLGLRAARIRASVSDRVAQRRRPTRPRMRALVLRGPGRLEWRDVPGPVPPGPDGAVVRPIAMATCDLDRPLALGRTTFPLPLQLGHECIAEVVSIGEQVRRISVGDQVVVPFQVSCGRCPACASGRTGSCRDVPPLSMFGFGAAGGAWGGVLADRVGVPFADAMLVPLPNGVDPAAAASSADTLADAYRHVAPHLATVLGHPEGPRVVALGAVDRSSPFSASVPLFVGLITRALLPGCDFLLVDERPWVRDQAERLGLAAGPVKSLRGRRAPLVVDASASPRGLRIALAAVAADGWCSCAGILHASARIPASLMFGRNVTLSIARSHIREAIPPVLDLLATRQVDVGGVITQQGSFDDGVELMNAHVLGRHTKTVLTVD